jgi:hypothetical protein
MVAVTMSYGCLAKGVVGYRARRLSLALAKFVSRGWGPGIQVTLLLFGKGARYMRPCRLESEGTEHNIQAVALSGGFIL